MKSMKTLMVGTLLVVLAIGAGALGEIVASNPELPPIDDAYRSPFQVHAEFKDDPMGLHVLLERMEHRAFADGITRVPVGPDEEEFFTSSLVGVAVFPGMGGATAPVHLQGPVQTIVRGKTGNQTGTFDTEIIAMSLTGDIAGMQVIIQQHQTIPSLGQTTITDLGGALWEIDSFFDVFTELSVDLGSGFTPFVPATEGVRMTLGPIVPEPVTMVLLGAALSLAIRRRRRS